MRNAYQSQSLFLGTLARLGKRDKVKVQNNTYLHRLSDDSVGIALYGTYVVIIYRDGRVRLNSGRRTTYTTKDRMNQWSGYDIVQRKGVWFVELRGKLVEYFDGMVLKGQRIMRAPKYTQDWSIA